MTDSAWLKYRAQATGKSIEQIRQEMRDLGAKADKSKRGLAGSSPEDRKRVSEMGLKARLTAEQWEARKKRQSDV